MGLTILPTIAAIPGLQTALDAKAPTASPTFSGVANFGGGTAYFPPLGANNPACLGLAGVWNDSGQVFSAINLAVTDTASAAASALLNLSVGGASKFSVGKGGDIVCNGASLRDVSGNLYAPTLYLTGSIIKSGASVLDNSGNLYAPTLYLTGSLVKNGASVLDNSGNLYTNALYFPGVTSAIRQISAALLEVNNGTAGNVGTLVTKLRLATDAAPASATDTGVAGQIRYDADFVYVCTETDTWVRAALATW